VGAGGEVHVSRRSKAECAVAIWDEIEAFRHGRAPWNRLAPGTV
jgi:hypothetical protein